VCPTHIREKKIESLRVNLKSAVYSAKSSSSRKFRSKILVLDPKRKDGLTVKGRLLSGLEKEAGSLQELLAVFSFFFGCLDDFRPVKGAG